MKNASAKQIEVIEYLKAALNPKAFFSTIGDILVRTSSDSKLTDADREVAQIWEGNKASKKYKNFKILVFILQFQILLNYFYVYLYFPLFP